MIPNSVRKKHHRRLLTALTQAVIVFISNKFIALNSKHVFCFRMPSVTLNNSAAVWRNVWATVRLQLRRCFKGKFYFTLTSYICCSISSRGELGIPGKACGVSQWMLPFVTIRELRAQPVGACCACVGTPPVRLIPLWLCLDTSEDVQSSQHFKVKKVTSWV